MADCKPRIRPSDCPETALPAPEPCLEVAPELLDSDCCPDDSVERGWYNARAVFSCPNGSVGASVTIPYATFWSSVSQADADAQASESAADQIVCSWVNQAQTVVCQLNNEGYHSVEEEPTGPSFYFATGTYDWPELGTGSSTIPAGAITSTVSQEDADEQALILAQSLLECSGDIAFPAYTFWPMDVFGIDDCEMYPIGALGSLYGGYSWVAAVVPFTPIDYTMGFDSSESYPTGALPSANGGTGWPAFGTFFTPS